MKIMSDLQSILIKVIVVCCALVSVQHAVASQASSDSLKPQTVKILTVDDVKTLMTTGPRLVVMWSLECPACFEELDSISALLQKYPSLPITLISTDDESSRREEVNEVYSETAFKNLPRWVYASGQKLPLRHAIDKTWHGELPRSFYIDKTGKKHGFSGLLTDKQLNHIVGLVK